MSPVLIDVEFTEDVRYSPDSRSESVEPWVWGNKGDIKSLPAEKAAFLFDNHMAKSV